MHYQNFVFKKGWKLLSLFLIVFTVLKISSCTNGDKKDAKQTLTETGPSKEAVASTDLFQGGKFAYLAISADTLSKIFGTPPTGLNSRKLVFRFSHDGTTTGNVAIEGFATQAGSNNYLKRPPVILEQIPLTTSFPGKKIYLADIEFSKAQYLNLGNAGTNTHLIFTPNHSQTDPFTNCITYLVAWGTPSLFSKDSEAAALVGGEELKPSPPADPGN